MGIPVTRGESVAARPDLAAVVPAAEADSLLAWFAEDLSNINTPRYCETPARWIAQTLAGAVVKGNLVGDPLVKLSSSSRKSKLV